MTSCCQHTLCHASWPRSASSLPARKWLEWQHWAQVVVPNKPMLCHSWYKSCRQKSEACPEEWLSLLSCCAGAIAEHVPERTGLAKGWAGIVIATETAAAWEAVRCCNLENFCTSYTGEDSSKMDTGTQMSLQGIGFTCACPCCSSACSASKTWPYKVSYESIRSSPDVHPWTPSNSPFFLLSTHQPDLLQDLIIPLPHLLPNFTVKLPSAFSFPGRL